MLDHDSLAAISKTVTEIVEARETAAFQEIDVYLIVDSVVIGRTDGSDYEEDRKFLFSELVDGYCDWVRDGAETKEGFLRLQNAKAALLKMVAAIDHEMTRDDFAPLEDSKA